jgi:hypothetical protein
MLFGTKVELFSSPTKASPEKANQDQDMHDDNQQQQQ